MNHHFQTVEFHLVLEKVSQYAHSKNTRKRLMALSPILDESLCLRAQLDTTGAKKLIECCGTPPLSSMDDLSSCVQLADAGGMLMPGQLYQIARFLVACTRMTEYLKRGETYEDRISFFSRAFDHLTDLRETIEISVDEERVFDDASPALRKLRREMEQLEGKMRDRLHQLIQSKKKWLADDFISQRNGHYVLPVLKQYQHQFVGTVIDSSKSGGTVFMEPASVASLKQEWDAAAFEEEQEVRRILYTLSDLVAQHAHSLHNNARLMDDLDFLFAKAAYSLEINACEALVTTSKHMILRKARHPLLDPASCVPLNLELTENEKGIVITGPNTGGKTVALKTVGLLTLMAQSGLHIPCDEGSCLPLRDAILCDIGDNQSISQNLSTFSGHMTNVISIIHSISHHSLVLLDELGSGTDPAEGTGIAIAILEALRASNCTFLVTTHYDQVKTYVQHSTDIVSARMAFDAASLRPLYFLEMGKTGKSCALDIVKRLGMPACILECAEKIVKTGTLPSSETPMQIKRNPSKIIASRTQTRTITTWQTGDSVEVLPEGEKGIVYQPADEQGNVVVQIKGIKRTVRHTRLKLLVPASELYPENYDFSIIFDTVENRKARHLLSRRYDKDATIIYRDGEE